MEKYIIDIEDRQLEISNPDRVIWHEAAITKLDYVKYLIEMSPFLLPYARNRMLMIWRYPDGIQGRRVEERSIHGPAPDWVPRVVYGDKPRILLNDLATLIWIANRGALELHLPFDRYDHKDYPTELVFDLDPAEHMPFDKVREVALMLREVLAGLSLESYPKTSGATGLQVFVPIEPKYKYEEARRINSFIARYLLQRMPNQITLERVVAKRGNKLYLDFLQLWRGRTMAAAYSVRAKKQATVSTPVTWNEIEKGCHPSDFTLATVPGRIKRIGDLFKEVSSEEHRLPQRVDEILAFIRKNE